MHAQFERIATVLRRRYVGVGAVVVLLGVGWVVLLLAQGYFYADDFLRLADASRATLSKNYLFDSVFGHLVPGWRLVYFGLQRLDPFGYSLAIAYTAIMQGLVLVFLYRILSALFGRTPWNHLLVGFYALSPTMVLTLLWFANTLHVVSSLVFVLGAMDCFVRYLKTRKRHYAIASVLIAPFGLAFFEKTSLLLVALPALVIVLTAQHGATGEVTRRALRRLGSLWPLWVGYLVPILIFSWYTTSRHYTAQLHVPGAWPWIKATSIAWADGFGTVLVGGPWRWAQAIPGYGTPDDPAWIRFVGVAALIGLMVLSVRLRPRAWLGWTFGGLLFVASFGLVVLGRLSVSGMIIAHDPAHVADALSFVLLGAGFAFLPLDPAWGAGTEGGEATSGAGGRSVSKTRSQWLVPVVLGATVVWFACAVSSNWAFRDQWVAASPRNYLSNLRADLNRLEASKVPFSIVDTPVPETVALGEWWPQNLQSAILPIGYPNLSYNEMQRQLWMADPATGHLRRAQFVQAAAVEGDHIAATTRQPRVCLEMASGSATFPVTAGLISSNWLLQLVGTPPTRLDTVEVTIRRADGTFSVWSPGPQVLEGNRATVLLSLPPGSPTSVHLALRAGESGSLCGIAIGSARPAPVGR